MRVKLMHGYYNEEYAHKVAEEMLVLGRPVIRVVTDGEMYYAVEGTHRLVACKINDMQPIFEIIEEGETAVIQWDGEDVEFEYDVLCDTVMNTPFGQDTFIYTFEEE